MELPSVQEAARPFRHGSIELTDTCWQEALQDYDHYGIPMRAEQQWRYQCLEPRKDFHEGPPIKAVSTSQETVHQGPN
jgi:hypothetical protein